MKTTTLVMSLPLGVATSRAANSKLPFILFLFLGIAASRAADTKPSPASASVVRNVGVEKFDQLRTATHVVVLDVRTPAEYAEGHLPGAILLDFRAPDFAEQVAKLDRSKEYLVHCAVGGRSARACTKMESLGFTNLVNLQGGLTAWKDAGKPVTK